MSSVKPRPIIIRLPASGRLVSLGQLYDCRSETLEEKYLWSKETISKATKMCVQKESSYSVFADETTRDRMAQLGIEHEFMVSILADLVVPLLGSSMYLNDEKLTQNKEKVTLKYKCTTKFEELDVELLTKEGVSCPHALFEGTGTHVVCGIHYGGQAFIVLDKLDSSESSSSIQRLLEAVQSLPNFQYDSQGRMNIPEVLEEETRGVRYLIYSDFHTPYKPRTYKEAARLITSFPHFVMSGAVKAVPIDICLYPLELLDPLAAIVIRNVDRHHASQLESTLEHLEKVIIECDDMLKRSFLTKFQETASNIRDFKQLVKSYKEYLQQQVRFIVTRIRSGTINENALETIFGWKESSPFAQHTLDVWVKHKHTQLQIIIMENVTSIPSSSVRGNSLLREREYHSVANETTESSPSVSSALPTVSSSQHHEDVFLISLHVSVHGKHSLTEIMNSYLQQVKSGFLQEFLTANTAFPHNDCLRENALQQTELFKDFVEANCSNGSLQFAFTEDTEENEKPDSYISIEKNDVVLHDIYQLPSKPECVKLVKAFHDRLLIQLPVPKDDIESICLYEVQYSPVNRGCKETVEVNIKSSSSVIELTNLKLGSAYEVRVRSVCEIGASVWSSSSSLSTLTATPPGKPLATHGTAGVVHLQWPKPSQMTDTSSVQNYIITVHNITTSKVYVVKSDLQNEGEKATITNLDETSTYAFSVRAVSTEGVDVEGEMSDVLEPAPNTTMKQELLQESKMIRDGGPGIYELNIKQTLQEHGGIRRCELGKKHDISKQKVILVVGATGAGKTTLINGMVNHILGVEWKDNFRFQLIVDSEEAKQRSQAESQTRLITSYHPYHQEGFKVPYNLTVIDTPGFGDTSGIKRDQEITQQIRNFFMSQEEDGINYIDAIGFVTQASLPRLTPTQTFIFDQVLALFGKDVRENIFLLVTFADGRTPPVLDGVEKAQIPYEKFFTFNNSALFVENGGYNGETNDPHNACHNIGEDDGEDFDEMFWEMSKSSFVTFFKSLKNTKPKSLVLTKDVLNERHRLETIVPVIHQHIKTGLNKLEQLSTEMKVLKKHEKDVVTNKKFTYKVTEESVKSKAIPHGTYITNCLTCNFTCHYPCSIQEDESKRKCDVMDKMTGKCMVCPSRCLWNFHKNMTCKFIIESVTKTKTAKELKARYKTARSGKISADVLIKEVTGEIETVRLKVLFFTDEIRKCLERLQHIALKPNPLSTVEYIDMLILSEQSQNHPRRIERIQQLEEVKQQAEILQQLVDAEFDPFKEYRDVFFENPGSGAKSKSDEISIFRSIKKIFSSLSKST